MYNNTIIVYYYFNKFINYSSILFSLNYLFFIYYPSKIYHHHIPILRLLINENKTFYSKYNNIKKTFQ